MENVKQIFEPVLFTDLSEQNIMKMKGATAVFWCDTAKVMQNLKTTKEAINYLLKAVKCN